MDDRRFDRLAVAIGNVSSRRVALRFLAGGALGALLTRLGREEAAAACGLVGEPCSRAVACCAGARCTRVGTCRCEAELTDCAGRCRDLQTSNNHCGTCNNACPGGQDCCAGACRDLQTSDSHCGRCGNACPDGAVCRNGACVCPANRIDCFGACCPAGEVCVGRGCCPRARACGTICCGESHVCENGSCQRPCPTGETRCDGRCVDARTNPNHCGGCNLACDPSETCAGSACQTADGCRVGADSCAQIGNEVCGSGTGTFCLCSTTTEGATRCGRPHPRATCGECDRSADCTAFGPGAFCARSGSRFCCGPDAKNVCRWPCPCPVGWHDCGGTCLPPCVGGRVPDPTNCQCGCPDSRPDVCRGVCVDPATDESHCGDCDRACPPGVSCVGGSCNCPAAIPTVCAGACVDTQTNRDHCGACDEPCPFWFQVCIDGTCEVP